MTATCNKIDELTYIKQNKPNTKGNILYDSIIVKYLEYENLLK